MKKSLIIWCLTILAHISLSAQSVQFHSTKFEAGVKYHLGLTESENITANQLDTITQLNLSGLGLTDIRDVRFLANLRRIDLSHNMIDNVGALAKLDSLRSADLSYNLLEDINMLAFSYSEKMDVDVSFNKISDLSLFDAITACRFTIEGAGLQNWNDAPFFHVRYLYSDGTSNKPTIFYRIETNTSDDTQLTIEGNSTTVLSDDAPHIHQLNDDYEGIKLVMVSNGDFSDSTYFIAPKMIHVDALEAVTIETGLPDDYEIRFSQTKQGVLTNEGSSLKYTAASDFNSEKVIYTFYQGGVLKGISKVILHREDLDTFLKGDVNGDGEVNDEDIKSIINQILGQTPEKFDEKAADMNCDGVINAADIVKLVEKLAGEQ